MSKKKKNDENDNDFIKNIVADLIDECQSGNSSVTNNEVEFNYQCGVCGKLFEKETDSLKHIDEIIKRLKEDSSRDKVNVAVKITSTITNQETKKNQSEVNDERW